MRFRCWQFDGLEERVEIAAPVIQQVNAAARAGFSRTPRGGVEVGGVLLGDFRDGVVRVMASEPLPISYERGAAFALTESDEEALGGLIHERGERVVGWYESHTRRDLALSDSDRQIFDTHFPEEGRICLAVRPQIADEINLALFFRTSTGTLVGKEQAEDIEDQPIEATQPPAFTTQTAATLPAPPPPIQTGHTRPVASPVFDVEPASAPARTKRFVVIGAAAALLALLAFVVTTARRVNQPVPITQQTASAVPADMGTRARTVVPTEAASAPPAVVARNPSKAKATEKRRSKAKAHRRHVRARRR